MKINNGTFHRIFCIFRCQLGILNSASLVGKSIAGIPKVCKSELIYYFFPNIAAKDYFYHNIMRILDIAHKIWEK